MKSMAEGLCTNSWSENDLGSSQNYFRVGLRSNCDVDRHPGLFLRAPSPLITWSTFVHTYKSENKSLYVHDPNFEWLHSLEGKMNFDPGQLSLMKVLVTSLGLCTSLMVHVHI